MANTCKTCRRNDVDEINELIINGAPLREITDKFQIPSGSAQRHKEQCLRGLFAEVREEKRNGLLAKIDAVENEIAAIHAEADLTLREKLVGRRFTAIELEAKLTGAFIKDQQNPADVKVLAKKVVQAAVAAGMDEDEAVKKAAERYGVLASELIG